MVPAMSGSVRPRAGVKREADETLRLSMPGLRLEAMRAQERVTQQDICVGAAISPVALVADDKAFPFELLGCRYGLDRHSRKPDVVPRRVRAARLSARAYLPREVPQVVPVTGVARRPRHLRQSFTDFVPQRRERCAVGRNP